jgi:hypothetical protein
MYTNVTFIFRGLYPKLNGLQYSNRRLRNFTAHRSFAAESKVPTPAGTGNPIVYSGFTLAKMSWILTIVYKQIN